MDRGLLLPRLACPDDGATPLDPAPPGAGPALLCRRCRRAFPLEDGIPRLLPLALEQAAAAPAGARRDVELRLSEARARDAESALYDELYSDAEYRHELDTYVRLLGARPDDVILDLGAGTGRVVKEYARSAAAVVAADFSRASLLRLARRPDLAGARVAAVEADATALPFASGSFDRAASLSLLCFLPAAELRARFVAGLARVLRPGGTLVVSTYHLAWVKRLWAALGRSEGALRQGFQSDGRIWYCNETVDELAATLAPGFEVQEVRGVCHRVPLLSNLGRGISRRLDGLIGTLPGGRQLFATEIVARCTRRG